MFQLGVKLVITKIYILLFMTMKYLTLSKLLHKYNKHFLSFYRLFSVSLSLSVSLCLCLCSSNPSRLSLWQCLYLTQSLSFLSLSVCLSVCIKDVTAYLNLRSDNQSFYSCLHNFICPQSLRSRAEPSKLIASEKRKKTFQRQIVAAFFSSDTPSNFGVVMFHSEMSISNFTWISFAAHYQKELRQKFSKKCIPGRESNPGLLAICFILVWTRYKISVSISFECYECFECFECWLSLCSTFCRLIFVCWTNRFQNHKFYDRRNFYKKLLKILHLVLYRETVQQQNVNWHYYLLFMISVIFLNIRLCSK